MIGMVAPHIDTPPTILESCPVNEATDPDSREHIVRMYDVDNVQCVGLAGMSEAIALDVLGTVEDCATRQGGRVVLLRGVVVLAEYRVAGKAATRRLW